MITLNGFQDCNFATFYDLARDGIKEVEPVWYSFYNPNTYLWWSSYEHNEFVYQLIRICWWRTYSIEQTILIYKELITLLKRINRFHMYSSAWPQLKGPVQLGLAHFYLKFPPPSDIILPEPVPEHVQLPPQVIR